MLGAGTVVSGAASRRRKAVTTQSVSVEFIAREDEKDVWSAELWQHGCTGVVESDAGPGRVMLQAFFDTPEIPEAVLDLLVPFEITITEIEPTDWVDGAKSRWQPFPVGDRFYLVPDWRDDEAPADRIRLSFNPGLAFGTGAHEATQQCLEHLERYVRPGMRVADIGCGSAILSIAAVKLGAHSAVGCDSDPVAIEIARERCGEANVSATFFQGSAQALGKGVADLVVCNINAAVDAGLAPDCLRALVTGGVCIAAGFEIYEERVVEQELLRAGAAILERSRKHVWSCFVYTAASGGAGNGPRTSSSFSAT
jgi:ribosomal protein L11 methyltransferase